MLNITPEQIYLNFDKGKRYQASIELDSTIQEDIDFFEGRQWAKATKNTDLMPRPVINVLKPIGRSKMSAIKGTPVKIVYKSHKNPQLAIELTRFIEYQLAEMDFQSCYDEAVYAGVLKGTYVIHAFWDADGDRLRLENIDCRNVVVSNPNERDEQKQKWIIISSREEVAAIREKAECNKDEIVADDREHETSIKEQEDCELCTVYTMYYREGGDVKCVQSTKDCIIRKPFSITPNIYEADTVGGGIDEAEIGTPDNATSAKVVGKSELYPIVIGSYEIRDNSIYGRGELTEYITVQRGINALTSYQILATQNAAFAKWIVLKGALGKQKIYNKPNQVLEDLSGTGGGIQYKQPQAPTANGLGAATALQESLKGISGATNVMTGESFSSSASGASIAQLQAVANQPNVELQKRYWRSVQKLGKILKQFAEHYYYNEPYFYEERDEEGNNEAQEGYFNSNAMQGQMFDVSVETTAGTNSSSASNIALLELAYKSGEITFNDFLANYPDDAISNKSELEEAVKRKSESDKAILQQQVQELAAANEQLQKYIETQNGVIEDGNSVINENKQLKALLMQVYAEANAKVQKANAVADEYDTTYKDATEMAMQIDQLMSEKQSQ